MKKLILTAAIASIFAACGNVGGAGSIKTEDDSLAYALGIDIGNNLKQMDSTINVDMLAVGIKDAVNNDSKMDAESAGAFLREYFMVRVPAKAKQASVDFLAGIEKDVKNIKKTESGLLYEVVLEGDKSITPKMTDRVRVIYEGKLKTGKIFDSSKQRGDTIEFAVNGVIKGWGEGLQLVGKGGKINLWIPAELAYGEQGAGGAIGPNEALAFEVELIDVMPAATEE